jgi:hypothetical protein
MTTLRKLWGGLRRALGFAPKQSFKAHLLAFPDEKFERGPATPRDVDFS